MRGRMNEGASYAPSQPLNEVMIGGTVGEVVDSCSARFEVGDTVFGLAGGDARIRHAGGQRHAEVSRNRRAGYRARARGLLIGLLKGDNLGKQLVRLI
jgi:NADPH-dependent curcumin reductase CurA